MREIVEFRVQERIAQKYLRPDEGQLLGDSVRKLVLSLAGERAQYIGKMHREIRREGKFFFLGWDIRRKYAEDELRKAELLQLKMRKTFEPAGEECGTIYDEDAACPRCGLDRRQIGDLFLSVGKIGKRTDIARTIAGEIIVSAHFVASWEKNRLTGASFRQVYRRMSQSKTEGKKPVPAEGWYQIVPTSKPLEVIPPTQAGIAPFEEDEKGEYECPGHVLGLNLLSELTVSRESYDGSDFVVTRQAFGCKRGLLRPERRLVISQRAWNCLCQDEVKGFIVEVVHLG